MKLGCCAFSYRKLLTAGTMGLEQFLDTALELGLDGVELTSYYFPEQTPAYLHHIRRESFIRGLEVSGTAVGGNFVDSTAEKRRRQVALVQEWLAKSECLGSPVLRVFAGSVPDGVSRSVAEQWVRDALEECSQAAERHGVVIALENHGGLTADADGILALIDPLADNPWIGINLDTGGFTGDIHEQFRRCAPHVVTTHAKVCARQGEERQLVDYRQVVRILREVGYPGYLSIEYEGPAEPVQGVARFAAYLRGCLVSR